MIQTNLDKTPIACVFSDLHFHNYSQYNEKGRRLDASLHILEHLASQPGVKLFCGDFFHEDQYISNRLFQYITTNLNTRLPNDFQMFGISGNHDMCEINTADHQSPSLFASISNVIKGINCIDYSHINIGHGVMVFGIPYLSYNIGLQEHLQGIRNNVFYKKAEKRILLIHTDLHGARDTDGRKIASVENINLNMNEFFDGFDLVFSGHIHKPQRINKKIIMVGAPNQQRKSDMGGKFGYWKVYSDMSYKFVPLKSPEFKFYLPSKDDINGYDYWVPLNEVEDDEQLATQEKKFYSTVNREKLAKRYCKAKGIKDKKKVEALKWMLND